EVVHVVVEVRGALRVRLVLLVLLVLLTPLALVGAFGRFGLGRFARLLLPEGGRRRREGGRVGLVGADLGLGQVGLQGGLDVLRAAAAVGAGARPLGRRGRRARLGRGAGRRLGGRRGRRGRRLGHAGRGRRRGGRLRARREEQVGVEVGGAVGAVLL